MSSTHYNFLLAIFTRSKCPVMILVDNINNCLFKRNNISASLVSSVGNNSLVDLRACLSCHLYASISCLCHCTEGMTVYASYNVTVCTCGSRSIPSWKISLMLLALSSALIFRLCMSPLELI